MSNVINAYVLSYCIIEVFDLLLLLVIYKHTQYVCLTKIGFQ